MVPGGQLDVGKIGDCVGDTQQRIFEAQQCVFFLGFHDYGVGVDLIVDWVGNGAISTDVEVRSG